MTEYDRIEHWIKAVKLEFKIINFGFSKIGAEAVYMMNIMREGVTWKNQLAKYMTVKSHSFLTRGQIFGYFLP